MRTIHTDEITKCIKEMCMQVNVDLSPDVKDALLAGKEKEESTIGKQILEQLEKNLEIAKESQIPICQDTGMTVVFLRIGQEVHIDGDFLEDAVNEGIRQGYAEGYLRKSVYPTQSSGKIQRIIHRVLFIMKLFRETDWKLQLLQKDLVARI